MSAEDTAREVIGDALHRAAHPNHPWSGCPYPDLWYDKVTAFIADLAAAGLTIQPVEAVA